MQQAREQAQCSTLHSPCSYPPLCAPSSRRNPFYKNERKTVEPHLLHDFGRDFYDEELRLLVCGYLRPEKNYSSLEALVEAIHLDISTARALLEQPPYAVCRSDARLR